MYSFHNIYYVESEQQVMAIKRNLMRLSKSVVPPLDFSIKVSCPKDYPAIMSDEGNSIREISYDEAMKYIDRVCNNYQFVVDIEADEEEVGNAKNVIETAKNFKTFLQVKFPIIENDEKVSE